VFFVVVDFSTSLIFAWLISSAGLGFENFAGKVLELKPLRYLGKITYGIYVYHYFPPLILVPLLNRFGYQLSIPSFENFVLSGLITIAVASVSWRWFEQPINNLKYHFQYGKPVVANPSDAKKAAIKG
jgi:peptidoglycan/LPS O-acetylase OafA/YrhL